MTDVYSPTTTANPQTSCLVVPSDTVGKARCGIKVVQVLLSFVAFVLEENVLRCSSCFALYFFEFVSCTAFLFTLLLLLLTTTTLQTRVGIKCWPKLDFVYTGVITVTFFVSSVIFATAHGDSSVEKAAVAFGFLASLMFFLDIGLFWKKNGFPFPGNRKCETDAAETEARPEAEKLNTLPDGE
nr:CKLF-like MARVEL transmembrane domain-containing protein 6 isoform X2 [Gasterosteus aculeatus aculeatus]XP_040021075.1 CKLF-like MARVEL transmembrane domain-containing protein 6 isoform X2 [Gasterosteus aculeatus aculeatus]